MKTGTHSGLLSWGAPPAASGPLELNFRISRAGGTGNRLLDDLAVSDVATAMMG